MKKAVLLVVLALLISCVTIQAGADGQTVNIEKLKMIEEEDTFSVRIIKKEVERSTGSIRFGDSDRLLITIQNNLDEDITGFELYLIAYDKDGKQVEIGNGLSFYEIKTPQTFSATVTITKHSEETLGIKCDSDSFSGARLIVSSYIDAESNEVENKDAGKWYANAYAGKVLEVIDFDDEHEWPDAVMVPGETINVEKLKTIEKEDSFPVKIANKQAQKGASKDFFEDDLFTFTIYNESDEAAYNPIIYIIGFDKETKPISLGWIKTSFPYVQILSFSEGNQMMIGPHSKKDCELSCTLNSIAGIRAIVASYEDASGTLRENDAATKWLEQMLESNKYMID